MNHKQRQLAAIRHETPDRIPVDAQAVENTDAVARLLRIPESAVFGALGLDGVCVGLGYAGSVGRDPDGKPLTEWGTPRYQDWGSTHVYRKRVRIAWILTLSYIPAVLLVIWLLVPSSMRFDAIPYVSIPYLAIIALSRLWLASWPCPRCGESYMSSAFRWQVRQECSNCGLSKWGEQDNSKNASNNGHHGIAAGRGSP